MRQLFQVDGKASVFVRKIAESIYMNLLWLICCIPLVTIGAATTALFYASQKICRDEDGNLTSAFFHSFRRNFKQATLIWLMLLSVGILLGIDGYFLYHMRFQNAFWTVLTAILIVAAAGYAVILLYIFPLLARFDNSIRAMFVNSFMIGMRFLLCTVLLALIYTAMAILIIFVYTPFIIFGMGTCALICSYVLSGILIQCEGKAVQEDGNEEEIRKGNG